MTATDHPPTTLPSDATTASTARGRWVKRWDDEIDPHAALPGVYRRKAGGFRIRGRVVVDSRTGRMCEVRRALPDAKRARDAAAVLAAELDRLKAGGTALNAPRPRFAAYAVAVLDRKVNAGRIRSAATREKWRAILRAHLIPTFGDLPIDAITASDIERWQTRYGAKVRAGDASPATGNTILAVMRVITAAAAREFDVKDPSIRVEPFDGREHRTYTREQPNSLAPADLPRFLDAMRERFPEFYAITRLGMLLGLRPSSLRPLRRKGPSPDVDLATGLLLVRRSHTRRSEVMEATKTGRDQRFILPPAALDVLRWHIDRLTGAAAESDLLFPNSAGGFLAGKPLRRAFVEVATAIGIPYRLTPRAMRRSFQDSAREQGVPDLLTREISGHATEAMQRHYSTARDHEVARVLAAMDAMLSAGPATVADHPVN